MDLLWSSDQNKVIQSSIPIEVHEWGENQTQRRRSRGFSCLNEGLMTTVPDSWVSCRTRTALPCLRLKSGQGEFQRRLDNALSYWYDFLQLQEGRLNVLIIRVVEVRIIRIVALLFFQFIVYLGPGKFHSQVPSRVGNKHIATLPQPNLRHSFFPICVIFQMELTRPRRRQ